jgi:D-glycero-alpha-D-manno-heptose-7-phosphate kinase
MDYHWREKIKRKGTSDLQINEWYELARKNGAIGGKLIGAGGGGFFLFYVENEKEKLRQAMKDVGLTEVFFRFDTEGVKIISDI